MPRSKHRTGMGHGCKAAIVGDWGISPEFFKRQLVDFCTAANWSAFHRKKFQSAQRHSQGYTVNQVDYIWIRRVVLSLSDRRHSFVVKQMSDLVATWFEGGWKSNISRYSVTKRKAEALHGKSVDLKKLIKNSSKIDEKVTGYLGNFYLQEALNKGRPREVWAEIDLISLWRVISYKKETSPLLDKDGRMITDSHDQKRQVKGTLYSAPRLPTIKFQPQRHWWCAKPAQRRVSSVSWRTTSFQRRRDEISDSQNEKPKNYKSPGADGIDDEQLNFGTWALNIIRSRKLRQFLRAGWRGWL